MLAYASRQSSYLIASFGAILQVVAGWWDVFSHFLFGRVDPWWNPAHLILYSAVAITTLGVWRGLRLPRRPPVSVSPIRFVNLAGLKLAGLGCVIEIVAGLWNEIAHRIFLSEPRVAPAHALLTVGMLTVNLGMVIGLTIEYGMIKHGFVIASISRRWATVVLMLSNFSAIWLAASGSLIFVAEVFRASSVDWITAVLLAAVATLVLVSAKRAIPRFGSGIGIGFIFNIVPYCLLVDYAGFGIYIPWGFLPLILLELVLYVLGRTLGFTRAVFISSLITGVFFWATYYPFTIYLFPWSYSLQPPTLAVFLGSAAGALLGDRVYAGLSSLVLGDVPVSL